MWKNSLKCVESFNNKILYETLLDFFIQRNGTYFLNKPRNQSTPTFTKSITNTVRCMYNTMKCATHEYVGGNLINRGFFKVVT